MLVTLDDIDNEVSAVALANAQSPMLVTDDGMLTDVSPEAF